MNDRYLLQKTPKNAERESSVFASVFTMPQEASVRKNKH